MFHDLSLLARCFRGFVLPVLDYYSAVWCSAADTHLKLLDRAASGSWWEPLWEWDIAHHRSVAELCMLYKIRGIRCTLLMVLYLHRMCQCGLHAVPWSHIGMLMRRLLQILAIPQTFIPLSVSLWNNLGDHVFDGVGLAGFKSSANVFLVA